MPGGQKEAEAMLHWIADIGYRSPPRPGAAPRAARPSDAALAAGAGGAGRGGALTRCMRVRAQMLWVRDVV